MKYDFLNQFYKIDPITGDYTIVIGLKEYKDIFTRWDSTIYNVMDLDSSLRSFIEQCSDDIGYRKKIKLRFNLKDQKKSLSMEETIESGVRNYFTYRLYLTENNFSTKRKRTFHYILASFLFTVPSIYFHSIGEFEIMSELILLSLTVGGWVFLWEAFSLLFIQGRDLANKKKQYKRIIDAPILFTYC